MVCPTDETFYPSFSPSLQCYDCPEIKRLDKKVNNLDVKLNGLLVTSLTTMTSVIAGIIGMIIWLL